MSMVRIPFAVAALSVGLVGAASGGCDRDGDAATTGTTSASASSGTGGASPRVAVQVLAINDFHGALEPGVFPGTTELGGGSAYLAAHLAKLRTPTSITVSAGDLVGGSPLVSGLFHDEPTIDVMNAMGLALNGVGNHEFDEGLPELLRLQNGGCHPVDGCTGGKPFEGAKFQFLAANVFQKGSPTPILPPYVVEDIGGAKIAFVGMTLEGTPAVTLGSAVKDLEFHDEVETLNALVPEIHALGAKAIVLMVHQGGTNAGAFDACSGVTGPIAAIAAGVDDSVKLIVSAHSHSAYNCELSNKLVTSAGRSGLYVTNAEIVVDLATQEVTQVSATNVRVTDDIAPDPTVAAIVQQYEALAAPIGEEVIGTITEDITRVPSVSGEQPMGDVVADAMLLATTAPPANAQIALMNSGGLRDDLFFAKSGKESLDGQVTYAEGFAVQPFSNVLLTVTITGAELDDILEHPVSGVVQIAGFKYVYDPSAPVGSRVDPADVMVGGVPLSLTASYRVTTNTILADATTGYSALAAQKDVVEDAVDLEALVAYFKSQSPVSLPLVPRIDLK